MQAYSDNNNKDQNITHAPDAVADDSLRQSSPNSMRITHKDTAIDIPRANAKTTCAIKGNHHHESSHNE